MRELNVNEIQDVHGGAAVAAAARAAGQVLIRIAHPAAIAVGAILILGGIAAGYMDAHENQ